MIDADKVVIDFIRTNFFTLSFVIGFLKILAMRSKNTVDDSIITLLTGTIGSVKGKSKKLDIDPNVGVKIDQIPNNR